VLTYVVVLQGAALIVTTCEDSWVLVSELVCVTATPCVNSKDASTVNTSGIPADTCISIVKLKEVSTVHSLVFAIT